MRITVWTQEELAQVLALAMESRAIALDFESQPSSQGRSALRPEFGARTAATGLAWLDHDGSVSSAYIAYGHYTGTAGNAHQIDRVLASSALHAFFRDYDGLVVVANATMELGFLLAEGWHWPKPGKLHDVQVMARVLNRGVGFKERIGLKDLAEAHLGVKHAGKSDLDNWLINNRYKPGADIWRAPVALASPYGQDDASETLRLFLLWEPLVGTAITKWWWHRAANPSNRQDLYELEMEVAQWVAEVSLSGMRYDRSMAVRRAKAAHKLQDIVTQWISVTLSRPVNPGSAVQVRGLLFTQLGLKIITTHMTDAFTKLKQADQDVIHAAIERTRPDDSGRYQYGPGLVDYASTDADALKEYADSNPAYGDLLFMFLVYRKCQTALTWFEKNVTEFAIDGATDRFWGGGEYVAANLIFHRIRSVGAVSGRMAAADFNGQQAVKRMKMLVSLDKLKSLLLNVFSDDEVDDVLSMVDVSAVNNEDESKMSGVPIGGAVVDFSVRAMFIARAGKAFRSHDLSQVEMRGFAHYTGNKLLCDGYGKALSADDAQHELDMIKAVVDGGSIDVLDGFLSIDRHGDADASEFDIHRFVAKELKIIRKDAKGVNFGLVYGMGKKKLTRNLGWTAERANKFFKEYHVKFPEVETLQEGIKAKLRSRGYVFDPYGRRYYLTPDRAYVGLNRLIQGWAASAFKEGFVRLCALLASPAMGGSYDPLMRRNRMDKSRVLNLVHDENLSEIPYELDTEAVDLAMRSCMTAFRNVKVPLASSSERGSSWDSMATITARSRHGAAHNV